MPYTLELVRGDRVVVITIADPFVADDILDSYRRTQEVYAKAKETVYMIVDARSVTKLPPNILSIIKQVNRTPHSKRGDLILVTDNRFVATIGRLMGKIVPSLPTGIVNSMDEGWKTAEQLIAKEATSAKN